MPISFTCPSCNSSLRLQETQAGRRGRCPKCRSILDIPQSAAPAPPAAINQPRAQVQPTSESHEELMRLILKSFEGEFPPVRRTFGYWLGLLLVTGAMIVLPILYVSLIVGAGAFVIWFSSHILDVASSVRSPLAVVFAVGGPLFSGVVLVFFMIKPLFAGSPKAADRRIIEIGQEPVLYAFVARIARAVGAPRPHHLAIDCQVNASASFGSGLAGLFGHNLVLTLGLPLVVGLTLPQLAGVVAHELGHFSQGMGMRLSFIVRSINGWFVRIVYERDTWDETLVEWSQESGRLSPIFLLARLCVFLTRGILFLFMLAAHGLSAYLLRQMEYDADRYEARLAGSAAFQETVRRIVALDLASQAAFVVVVQGWGKDCYPEDFSAVVVAQADALPSKALRSLEKELKKGATGWFDSHPCFKQRVAKVRQEDAPGIFHLDRPATVLFRDYRKLARRASLDFYRGLFGKRIKKSSLVADVESN